MVCLSSRHFLNVCSPYVQASRPFGCFLFVVYKSVDWRIRIQFMKTLKHLLCTALAYKPVVNECDSRFLSNTRQLDLPIVPETFDVLLDKNIACLHLNNMHLL